MNYIENCPDFYLKEPTVVTIGKFDGRHRGHQKLLSAMLDIKKTCGYKTAVFTFSIAPVDLVEGKRHTVITTNLERKNNLQKMGMDVLVEYPFTREVSQMSAEEFVREILVGRMQARAIVVGTDCGFGYKRSGNAKLLEKLSPVYGYHLVVIEKEKEESCKSACNYASYR